MKSFKNYLQEAKVVRWIVMPLINKGKIKKTDSIELHASSPKEAREKAAKKFGLKPDEMKAVTKFEADKHMNEAGAANSIAGGGVSLPPIVHANKDKRKKYSTERMYRRSLGIKALKEKN